jgi:hypothetical protein
LRSCFLDFHPGADFVNGCGPVLKARICQGFYPVG